MRTIFHRLLAWIILLTPLFCSAQAVPVASPTSAINPQASVSGNAQIPSAPNPAAMPNIEAFVDGLVRAQQRTPGTAGIVVSVVDKNGIIFSKGYGFSKLEPKTPVSTSDSLFRIGSISKTFTYLAATNLIERGQLNLDDDVNRYLPEAAKVPDAAGYEPVRIRHLLTHTAGFEDLALGHLFVDKPERVLSLEQYLIQYRPARVRSPGKYAVYSNYSVSMLGYIVARVSKQDFDTHVEGLLFKPLGMNSTTFREPLDVKDSRNISANLKTKFPSGFARGTADYTKQNPEYIAQIGPAGGVSSSAEDMARYMRMLLNQGELDGVRVLPAGVFERLKKPLFRNAEEVGSLNYGFMSRRFGNTYSLEHGGATLYFHSNMVVLPELGVGVFVSTNTDNGRPFSESLPRLIFERYFPQTQPSVLPAADKKYLAQSQELAGNYRVERRAFKGLEAFIGLFESQISVTPDSQGDLIISGGPQPIRWRAIAKDVYAEVEGMNRLSILRDSNGLAQGFASGYGINVSSKIPFWQGNNLLFWSLGGLFLFCILTLRSSWLARKESRRSHHHKKVNTRMITVSAVVWLLFLVTLAYSLIVISSIGEQALYNFPSTSLVIAQWMGRIASVFAALAAINLFRQLLNRDIKKRRRFLLLITVALMLSCSALLWFHQLTAF
jgi:CubicO group peptidase (beta-lactamase class C family)